CAGCKNCRFGIDKLELLCYHTPPKISSIYSLALRERAGVRVIMQRVKQQHTGIKSMCGNFPHLSSSAAPLDGSQAQLSSDKVSLIGGDTPLRGHIPPEHRPKITTFRTCGFLLLLSTQHSVLFWMFPSSTTKALPLLENSRNFQKISAFLRSVFWITFQHKTKRTRHLHVPFLNALCSRCIGGSVFF
ncbi:MAG: hypothetical protein ABI690_33625, partial [Chloroflexota bacterium]